MDPAVSVCVPTWNGETHIAETLRCVLAQSYADLEILVVDDGSTDGTLDVVRSFRDTRLRVEAHADRRGLPGNWNRALHGARGRYALVLCQDDVLLPEAVAALHEVLDASPSATLAFGRRRIRYEGVDEFPLQNRLYEEAVDGFLRSFRGQVAGRELVTAALREGRDLTINVVGEPSFVLLRREAALAAGGFDDAFRQLPDWELWLRLAHAGPLAFADRVLGDFRVHAHGASWRGLAHVPRENVRLLHGLRRLYGAELDGPGRRRLHALEWRHRWRLLVQRLGRVSG